ncbi:MAG: tRNA (adenosine(37)-N6)-dimethylallyltransferase MiaA [Chloroflexi bacterium]|nr:tRNA (adenosine(37)-N6)-dimethylallyltransferase MiaA [Chloroflexota bacterium]
MESATQKLVVVVGPTGVGKSGLGLRLAETFGGEVVNADSRQVCRRMDIGTAKPSVEARRRVPHHLFDLIEPDGEFSLALFLEAAREAIQSTHQRGRVPLLVGGTGQYVWGLLEGWQVPRVPPSPETRAALREEAGRSGSQALYKRLLALDPALALEVDPRNVRRVIRALEIASSSGKPLPGAQRKAPPPYECLVIGLTMPRRELYRLLDERLDTMMARGFLDEVRALLQAGYSQSLSSMSSAGYGELARYLKGEWSLEEALAQTRRRLRRIVRHQYSWFRLSDPRIRWLDACQDPYEHAAQLVGDFLSL